MGSFNVRCFLSRQNINPDDECILFPIYKNIGYRTKIETVSGETFNKSPDFTHDGTTWWKIFCTPLKTVYEDYGQFSLVSDEIELINQKNFLNLINKIGIETLTGSNSSHDKGYSKSIFAKVDDFDKIESEEIDELFNEIQEVVRCRGLFVGEKLELRFAVCRKDVFDYVVNRAEKTPNWCGEKNPIKKVFKKSFEECFSPHSFGSFTTGYHPNMYNMYKFFRMDKFVPQGTGDVVSSIQVMSDKLKNDLEKFIRSDYDKKTHDIIMGVLFKKFEPVLKCARFVSSMHSDYGAELTPIEYSGQDYHNEVGLNFSTMVKTISEKIKKERD